MEFYNLPGNGIGSYFCAKIPAEGKRRKEEKASPIFSFCSQKCSQIIDNFDGPQSVFPFMEIALLYPCKIAKNSW